MSCGFGGRLIASSLNPFDFTYIGTDPSTPTMEGLKQINEDFNIGAELYHCGSEDFIPDKHSLEFCFTSPPYFDTEKYTDEDTQSYKKFPDKLMWANGFLKTTFDNCYHGLKPNCFMAINIANTKSFPDAEEHTVRVAIEAGFKHVDTWKLALSNPQMKKVKAAFKYEPIFIFRKEAT